MAGGLCLRRRALGFAPKVKDESHDLHFDLIPHGFIDRFAAANGIFDGPFANGHGHADGQRRATHVHDEIEGADRDGVQALGRLGVDIDVLGFHDLFRQGLNDGSWREAGACRFHDIGAVLARKAFRHLAAAGIADAEEEDLLHLSSLASAVRQLLYKGYDETRA